MADAIFETEISMDHAEFCLSSLLFDKRIYPDSTFCGQTQDESAPLMIFLTRKQTPSREEVVMIIDAARFRANIVVLLSLRWLADKLHG